MTDYNVTGHKWIGYTTYNNQLSATLTDDDSELDWSGQDPGSAQSITINGVTYNNSWGGTLSMKFEDNDNGGAVVTETFLFVYAPGYGWFLIPPPGSSFTNGDKMVGRGPGGWGTNIEYAGVVCFTPGSMIATPIGPRPIETLSIGDLVITKDRGLQAIRWVGRKEISGARLHAFPHLTPVKISAGSLGDGKPIKDMWVHPSIVCSLIIQMRRSH